MTFDFFYAECTPLDERKRKPRLTRRKTCAECLGRGWVQETLSPSKVLALGQWPTSCPRCNGAGKIRPLALARALGLNRRDVYKVDTLTAGSKVGQRVFAAIARVFPEALL